MAYWTRREVIGSLSGVAAATSLAAQKRSSLSIPEKRNGHTSIKITDLRCAIIGKSPVIRIVTDQGISGYGEAESYKPYLKPMVLFYKEYVLGEDPTNVDRVMLKIRRLGAFKPWGAAVSDDARYAERVVRRTADRSLAHGSRSHDGTWPRTCYRLR